MPQMNRINTVSCSLLLGLLAAATPARASQSYQPYGSRSAARGKRLFERLDRYRGTVDQRVNKLGSQLLEWTKVVDPLLHVRTPPSIAVGVRKAATTIRKTAQPTSGQLHVIRILIPVSAVLIASAMMGHAHAFDYTANQGTQAAENLYNNGDLATLTTGDNSTNAFLHDLTSKIDSYFTHLRGTNEAIIGSLKAQIADLTSRLHSAGAH